jgi:hypothetical protein
MNILFGITLIFFGAFLTETPLDHELTMAVISGLLGIYIAVQGYCRLLYED